MADEFWDAVNAQCDELESAKSADDVMRILSQERSPYRIDDPNWSSGSEGFFAGSGGERSFLESVSAAGWRRTWAESGLFYVVRSPNGDEVTYCEGDVGRGRKYGAPAV